jgi:ElaA protein
MVRAMPKPPAARSSAHPSLHWQFARLPDLPPADLYAALAARQSVFVMEQDCPFQDADGADADAWHLLGWDHARGERTLACYLRLVDPGIKFDEPSLGRVLTTAAYRRTGLGRTLMREGLARAAALYPRQPIRIAAQARLELFYAGLGFHTVSAPYEEDGIPHIQMLRHASAPAAAPQP